MSVSDVHQIHNMMEVPRHYPAGNSTDLNVNPEPCQLGNESFRFDWFYCIAEIHTPLAISVDRIVTPFWYLIGIIGNSVTIKVWTSRKLRRNSTSALYLTMLAITDLIFLCFHIFLELHFAWRLPSIDAPIWCSLFFVIFMFAQYMSPLLVFGFTIERFVAILKPFRSERFSRHSRASKEITVIIIFALAISIVQTDGWEYSEGECKGTGSKFFDIWSWVVDILMFGVIPLTVFILNLFVMRAAKNAVKMTDEPCLENGRTNHTAVRKRPKFSPSTLTLLLVSFYRIFTTLPVSICYALQVQIQRGDTSIPVSKMYSNPVWRKHFQWFTVKKIIDEIGLSQYSLNIFIYIATSKRFRLNSKDFISSIRR